MRTPSHTFIPSYHAVSMTLHSYITPTPNKQGERAEEALWNSLTDQGVSSLWNKGWTARELNRSKKSPKESNEATCSKIQCGIIIELILPYHCQSSSSTLLEQAHVGQDLTDKPQDLSSPFVSSTWTLSSSLLLLLSKSLSYSRTFSRCSSHSAVFWALQCSGSSNSGR